MSKIGFIYRIDNDVNSDFYIGSTTRKLCKRMADHRGHSKQERYKNRAIYKLMNEIGVEHFKIYLVEEVKFNSKQELVAREGHYIRTLKPTLNKNVAGRTYEEWYEANREQLIEQMKQYNKQYYENNKEQVKSYQEANKDKIIEYRKSYYLQNKQKLLEQMKKTREAKKNYLTSLINANNTQQDRNEDSIRHPSDSSEGTTSDSESDL